MQRKSRQFRVGFLVLCSMGLFVAMVFFILGSSIQSEMVIHYIRFEENVKGMVIGSVVNFQGVPIGTVTDIRFDAGNTLVEVSVDPTKAVIQDVTTAHLDRLLVTGQVTVELDGYLPDAPELEPGSTIASTSNPISELTMGLPEVVQNLHGLMQDTRRVLNRVELLLNDENLDRVGNILERFETASERLPAAAEGMIGELHAALSDTRGLIEEGRLSMRSIAKSAEAALEEFDPEHLQRVLTAAERSFDRLTAVESTLVELGVEARGLLTDNRYSLHTLLLSARDALRELQAFSRNLRAAPSSLLFGVESHEISVPAAPGGGPQK